ncbi:MAG: hypothetical protein EBR82_50725 [Caulobacteraceae bacterium]|nr:hypothetical protein [Caulobacteraceae bacterium]
MNITLFTPHKGQRAIIDGFADSKHKFCVVATGRQFGKSLLGQNLMLYWLLQNKGKGAWISPIYKQCQKVFEELSQASQSIIKQANKADLTIKFINGSTLQFLSTDNYDTIRGYSFDYMVIDEAAYIRKEAIELSILPTLSARGKKCLIISTPRSKNWFYTWYLRGKNNDNIHISFEGLSIDNPYVDAEFIETQKQSLPIDIYEQEYLAKFSEATNDVFRNLDLTCIIEEYDTETIGSTYFGIDVGLSNDYTVCTLLTDEGTTKGVLRFNGESIENTGNRLIDFVRRHNCKGGYVETNNVGQAIFELMRKAGVKVTPWNTNNENKVRGIRKLINDIEVANIILPSKNLMPELYNELSMYSYKINANGTLTFSAPSGQHDDIVMSLMLANMARNEVFGNSGKSIYVGGSAPRNKINLKWG